ncbi:ATPase [Parapedobacter defluvii]|uniref:ATPase n=1 Tax=Parapedobacter defluvii TaxID=2045106 RepID=A0ABQ1MFS8_9SPHI|nr:ATP-binding protein [Parapedobacter defluvii]GGC38993.1 ATPase [Parapedobacter defluvii]
MINRDITQSVHGRLADEKAIILLGPRQVGKSTLLKQLAPAFQQKVVEWSGDDADVRTLLANPTATMLRQYIGAAKTLVIDEAQRIENIGLCIKLIVDQIPGVKVIATGSSAFDLANRINEPLTGRKWEYRLYPFSFGEMVNHHGFMEENRLLNHRLIYGYYPEIVNNPGEEEVRLKQLSGSYLYKDILTWERIQKPDKMERLVQALAFQLGNEVSFNELGQLTGLDNETTEKYVDLLEKSFIVFRLGSLSRNLRNELKKSRKFYFYDNGLRNAVINQFSPVALRQDIGALWENFVVSERVKYLAYREINCNRYFWRTHAQQEVDYIEERNGQMNAYEFKWNVNTKARFPKTFLDAYPGTEAHILTPENFQAFLLES